MTQAMDQLISDADRYGDAIMKAIGTLKPDGQHDARVVVLACAEVAGSFTFSIADPELKRALVKHRLETLIKYSGVSSLRVVEEQ